jgi:glycosyltransferase involved in cell wall biosynthesis
MPVALVGSFYPPYVGGIESHMAALASGLHGRGETVRVVCLQPPEQSHPRFGLQPTRHIEDGIEVVRVPDATHVGKGWRLPLHGFDVVHFHGFSRPLFLRALTSKDPAAALVLTPHGALTFLDERQLLRRAVKSTFDASCGPFLRRRVSRVIALTDQEKHGIEQRYRVLPKRIVTIPSPLPAGLAEPSPGPAASEPRFLALTRLAPRKNLQDLIAALERDPSLPGCDIAGPDDGAGAHLRELANRLPPGRVRFCAPLSGDEKMRALRDAIALVLPSSWEMLSIAALEAISVGTPIVASEAAASGLPAEALVTYPTGSITDLVRSLHTAVDRRSSLQEQVRKAADSWPSHTQWVERTLAAYRDASR